MIESSNKEHLVRNQSSNENNLMRIRSTENINYDEYNQQMDQLSYQRRFNNREAFRGLRAGSLSNLDHTSDTSVSESGSNYFSKKVEKINMELYEYLSTPFYGYQKKTLDKVDFSNGKQKLYNLLKK